jgi:hypothetical protein
MHALRFRLARWVMRHRRLSMVAFLLITVGFGMGLPGVQLKTIFSDLLPKDDPFVQVYKDHPNFGNPLTMTVMIQRKDGDIYNAETLQKVWQMTRDIDLSPGVDHDQILSIATEKARYAEATPYGIDMRQSSRGTSFLNIWPYDHSTFPVLYGYVPEFKRVRQFPTDQRFEPLIPGSTLYLSDAWAAGDPLYTWGNYRIVGRGPALCALDDNWNPDDDNWHHATHGGPEGKTFWDTTVELVPEAIICEAEPVKFPRAPVSKKRVWFDARTGLPVAMVSYDRRGQAYRSFDAAFSLYQRGDRQFLDGAHPYWSWAHVHAFDLQTRAMTRLEQVRKVSGHETIANDPGMYDRYLTQSALSRLGS